MGKAIHRRLTVNAWEGTTILKFIHGQLYNGKLEKRYGHAPTDECPLCHKPDSCTYIAGECSYHEALTISRHSAACQLIHAAIRKSAKGGGSLYSAPDIVLVTADAGSYPQTAQASLETLISALSTEESDDDTTLHTNQDWLDPLPSTETTRIKRHTDVSQDPIYIRKDLTASEYDAECTAAPSRIPPWVLLVEETQAIFEGGHDTAPDLICAKGGPATPDPGLTNFDKKLCSLILIEVGFSRDLGCDKKHEEKTEKYSSLVASLKGYWG